MKDQGWAVQDHRADPHIRASRASTLPKRCVVLRSVDIIHRGELAAAGAGPEDKVAGALPGPGIGAAELGQVQRQKQKGEASGSGIVLSAFCRTQVG